MQIGLDRLFHQLGEREQFTVVLLAQNDDAWWGLQMEVWEYLCAHTHSTFKIQGFFSSTFSFAHKMLAMDHEPKKKKTEKEKINE